MILVCYDMREVWTNHGDRYYRNYNSGEQDASIAAATMMYEAEELGVHTIWIRGFDSKTVVDTFGLPEHMIPALCSFRAHLSLTKQTGVNLRRSQRKKC